MKRCWNDLYSIEEFVSHPGKKELGTGVYGGITDSLVFFGYARVDNCLCFWSRGTWLDFILCCRLWAYGFMIYMMILWVLFAVGSGYL